MIEAKPILVVDDDKLMLDFMRDLLLSKQMNVVTADNVDDGLINYFNYKPFIVFLDLNMPKMNGIELMEKILEQDPNVSVIIFTGESSIEPAVEAMRKGAYDYVSKPVEIKKITLVIDRIIQSQTFLRERNILQEQLDELFGFRNFIGVSPQIKKVYEQIKQVSQTDSTVLITGDSGTGKEIVANALHYSSKRKQNPYIKVNCAALPETIIESELFGHEKGAFTSAVSRRIGRFELANGGSIFLDEIGDIPVSTQVKLLRVLEARDFERLGGNETIKVDIRLITATNRNLEKAVKEGKFREDLYYRLNVINIKMAPLIERKEDIPILANHFLNKYAAEMNKSITKFSKKAMDILQSYPWPGNVRELVNAIERSVVFCKGKILTEKELPPNINAQATGLSVGLNLPSFSLAEAEKSLISKVLEKANWNLKHSAELLQISRGTLYSKIERHEIQRS
ncbi:sigma-54-dependent Fis family transcriptional regulator [candidate division KSB1 bacterium]|nr:sigma-54-dependent Fis family transcriptional regulator [candidate division KSB1 bacterium]